MASPLPQLWRRFSWRSRITGVLILWLGAESLAFALVVQTVGVAGALLLGLATSLVGASLAKRLGRSAFAGLRRGAGGQAVLGGPAAVESLLAGVGAALLLLPGFLTDGVGLLLAVPAIRQALASWVSRGGLRAAGGRPRAQHGPAQIDLERGDWRADEELRRPVPKA